MLEEIYEDDQKTILKECNHYSDGLLQKKYLYINGKLNQILVYEYGLDHQLIQTHNYDYQTFCQMYNMKFKKSKPKRKRRKLGI